MSSNNLSKRYKLRARRATSALDDSATNQINYDRRYAACLSIHDNQRGRTAFYCRLFNVERKTVDYHKKKLFQTREDEPQLYAFILKSAQQRLQELENSSTNKLSDEEVKQYPRIVPERVWNRISQLSNEGETIKQTAERISMQYNLKMTVAIVRACRAGKTRFRKPGRRPLMPAKLEHDLKALVH